MEQDTDVEALHRAVENAEKPRGEVPDLRQALDNAPFPNPGQVPIRRDGDTEDLLNGMIAELHFLMREIAAPSASGVSDGFTRQEFLRSAMDMARTGAHVGKTVARLRAANVATEVHQR